MSQQSLRDRAAGRGGGQELTARDRHELQQLEAVETMGNYIGELAPEIARALPAHLEPQRLARLAMVEIRKNPELADCSRASFVGGLLTTAQLGLEFGPTAEAYLVPYKREATVIVGYQGLSKLFYQHPLGQVLDAQAVYSRDAFDFAYGLDPTLRHRPYLGPEGRGELVAYYGVAGLTTGARRFVVLSPAEVRELRNGKVGPSGRIADPQRWMERKTALRQVLKMMPKSTTLATALDVDETVRPRHGLDVVPPQAAIPAAPPREQSPRERIAAAGRGDGPQQPQQPVQGLAQDQEEDGREPLTRGQQRALFAAATARGFADRAARLEWLSQGVGRPLGSSNDLTVREASTLLARLQLEPEGDAGPAEPDTEDAMEGVDLEGDADWAPPAEQP